MHWGLVRFNGQKFTLRFYFPFTLLVIGLSLYFGLFQANTNLRMGGTLGMAVVLGGAGMKLLRFPGDSFRAAAGLQVLPGVVCDFSGSAGDSRDFRS